MNIPVIIMIIAGILLQALFIKVEHDENYLLATILKGSAALMFVLVGYLGFLSTDNIFNRQFLIGLIFGMIGDILLELRYVFKKNGDKVFLLGILSFMIGHIMYPCSPDTTSQTRSDIWSYWCPCCGMSTYLYL